MVSSMGEIQYDATLIGFMQQETNVPPWVILLLIIGRMQIWKVDRFQAGEHLNGADSLPC